MEKLDSYQRKLVKKVFGWKKQADFLAEVKKMGVVEQDGVMLYYEGDTVICELRGIRKYIFCL
mgnify:CR=1 FL=1